MPSSDVEVDPADDNGGLRPAVVRGAGTIDITPFFAVPFGFARLEACEELNGRLRERLIEMASAGTRYANPRPLTQRNSAVFETHFRLFQSTDEAFVELRKFCLARVFRLVADLNGYTEPELARLRLFADAWGHVTRRGGYFGLHNHPNASWSGVYCVDPGRHDADAPDSGLLTFVHPAISSAMYRDAGVARMSGPYAYALRQIRVEAGQLVVFPSWILHDVKPFQGEGERITIAFNCWFSMTEATSAR